MLRDVQPSDVATLFAFECDPAWCAVAMVKPRSKATFEAVWEKIFQDRAGGVGGVGVVQKVILADAGQGWEVCGSIGCRMLDGRCTVGYGLGRAHWGRGIASRAVTLLLAEGWAPLRPLHATAAAANTASIRVLTKNGFVMAERRAAPETERFLACDVVSMVLV